MSELHFDAGLLQIQFIRRLACFSLMKWLSVYWDFLEKALDYSSVFPHLDLISTVEYLVMEAKMLEAISGGSWGRLLQLEAC